MSDNKQQTTLEIAISLLIKAQRAFNMIPNTKNVGPNCESSYEIVSEIDKFLGALPRIDIETGVIKTTNAFPMAFKIDGNETVYHGLSKDEHWNGFEVPYFDYETACKVALEYSKSHSFDDDMFTLIDTSGHEETYGVTMINGQKYWSIGGWSWIWSEYKDDEEDDTPRFRNYYRCYECQHEWTDDYSAQPDDNCPSCGARAVSPYKSEDTDIKTPPPTEFVITEKLKDLRKLALDYITEMVDKRNGGIDLTDPDDNDFDPAEWEHLPVFDNTEDGVSKEYTIYTVFRHPTYHTIFCTGFQCFPDNDLTDCPDASVGSLPTDQLCALAQCIHDNIG